MLAISFAVPGLSLSAQGAQGVRLSGSIVDEHGNVVPNAELTLRRGKNVESSARSDDGGLFDFGAIAPGTVLIVAQRLGYQRQSLEVNIDGSLTRQSVKLDLVSVPANIEKVVIEESSGRLQEFIEHRTASKFGQFFDQNQIRSKNPRYLSELFRAVPGARLEAQAGGGSKLVLRGCKPKIWLDGVLAQYAEIDEVIAPSEIAGIEVYPSMSGVPPQYMDRENRACGTVLIWSRQT
jgi:hypothetical protein